MSEQKLELLAPAGDLEKLKIAVTYGADAVYFGGEFFSLRQGADNLTIPEIEEGLAFAHEHGCKGYMALNIFAHNEDLEPMRSYLKSLRGIPIDGFLVSDPGVLDLVKEELPRAEIHLSTQANMTNYQAAAFWRRLGVKRLVLARELSIEEIREIRRRLPEDVELEAFIHGSMCISYSGRCLLSNFMTGRDSNRGLCAHPCRYRYVLEEEKRPGMYFPIEEDDRGSYILNSKDLCMIDHIPDLARAGVKSLKIEGRMKSIFYVATVVHAYRLAIDAYLRDPENFTLDPALKEELLKVSHREFTTGFYYGEPDSEDQNYETSKYIREYSFVGKVLSYDPETHYAVVEQRNKMLKGDEIEVFGPDIMFFRQTITSMLDQESGLEIESAPHPQQIVKIRMEQPVKPDYILRKKVDEQESPSE